MDKEKTISQLLEDIKTAGVDVKLDVTQKRAGGKTAVSFFDFETLWGTPDPMAMDIPTLKTRLTNYANDKLDPLIDTLENGAVNWVYNKSEKIWGNNHDEHEDRMEVFHDAISYAHALQTQLDRSAQIKGREVRDCDEMTQFLNALEAVFATDGGLNPKFGSVIKAANSLKNAIKAAVVSLDASETPNTSWFNNTITMLYDNLSTTFQTQTSKTHNTTSGPTAIDSKLVTDKDNAM